MDTYFVDRDDCAPMVLDALIWIKNKIDPTLTFRRSCREGVCGSCAMNIDGTNTLACTKGMDEINGTFAVYPLPHAGGQGPGAGHDELLRAVRLDRAVAANRDADAGEGMEAEPRRPAEARRPLRVYSLRLLFGVVPELLVNGERYLGPAALLQANRWIIDSRDEATGARLDDLEDPFRLYRCHTIMNCSKACPKGLNPAKAIAEIKKKMVERQV